MTRAQTHACVASCPREACKTFPEQGSLSHPVSLRRAMIHSRHETTDPGRKAVAASRQLAVAESSAALAGRPGAASTLAAASAQLPGRNGRLRPRIIPLRIGTLHTMTLRQKNRLARASGKAPDLPDPFDNEKNSWAEAIEDGGKFYYRRRREIPSGFLASAISHAMEAHRKDCMTTDELID